MNVLKNVHKNRKKSCTQMYYTNSDAKLTQTLILTRHGFYLYFIPNYNI